MKKYPIQLLLLIIFINISILFSTEIIAATHPPDPGGDPSGGGGDPVGGGAPIGNGVWFLMGLATTYLLWKLREILFKDLLFPWNSD